MKMFPPKFFRCLSLYFLLLAFPCRLHAQLSENFSDGDFTANPQWLGKTDSFYIDNGMLRSNGPQVTSNIYLATANTMMDSTEWNFLIRLDFNPSSTNYVRVYLASDQQNLAGSLNGYYVQFGAAGTGADTLLVFRQNGNTATKLFTGVQGCMASNTSNLVRVKIVRHEGGNWEVYADCTGGNNFSFEGNFSDNTFTNTAWFGVACRYTTASRYNLYFFDDFSIKYLQPDSSKPQLISASVVSPTQLDVTFSEAVELASSQNTGNYSINNSIGNPISANRDAVNLSLVHLTLANTLQNGTNYQISVSNVKDLAGNVMNTTSVTFSYYTPAAYDVLINEIMADPTPVVGLPELEFVELYNRSPFDINISGWKFSDASTTVLIPNVTLKADSFLILCANAYIDSFSAWGKTAGLSSLPSLNNTGDNLSLKDANNNLIHSINYSDKWYGNSTKANGGYTLELINPNNPCKEEGNWIGSNNASGGTPGKRNSVWNPAANSSFSLNTVNVVSVTELELTFSENFDLPSTLTAANYQVNKGVGHPNSVAIDSTSNAKVRLSFSMPFNLSEVYTITVDGIFNCSGNMLNGNNSLLFAVPQNPTRFDVLIHELLPDPTPAIGLPDAEYVELYNRSNKAFNLKDWTLTKPGITDAKFPDYLLLPDSFLIVTSTNNAPLFSSYGKVLGLSSFPSLTNTADQIMLKDKNGDLVHYVSYDDTWYLDNGKKNGGWSLEMIDRQNPCSGKENWKASVDATGGTPGRKNSVEGNNPDTIPLRLVHAYLEDNNTLLLQFNEPVSVGSASVANSYTVNNGVGAPLLALPIPFDYTTVRLEFLQDFTKGVIYTIKLNNSITDCSGNGIGLSDTARFAIADSVEPNDIVINEILFNPRTYGYDFVELYNRSQKVIDLKDLEIVEKDISDPTAVLELGAVTVNSFLLFPQQFVAVTESRENILQNYYVENADYLLQSSLPNFPDKNGICVLKVHNGITIDSLCFSNSWHYALLDNEEGVSLERIDYHKPTQDKANWHSAASSVGFATPTYRNSQFSETGITESSISIEPELFTPDNDGDKDFTFIQYKFDEPGYTMNCTIYDIAGREIRHLVKNETLGSEGKFMWDGIDDNNQKARVGIYIAHVEVFNLQGKVKRYKKQLVLAAKFN
jgi:hypothetical protein